MSITDYTFRLLLLFLPGIVSFIIIDNLTTHKSTKPIHWLLYSMLLGFLSYLPWMILAELFKATYSVPIPTQFISSLNNSKIPVNFYEILIATFFSIIWGLFIAKALNNGWFYSIASWLGVSNKFPEIDSWSHCLAKYTPTYIVVMDKETHTSYEGILDSTSDANDRDGLVLLNVTVYPQGVEPFHSEVVYLPTKMENLVIHMR